jgi:tetratricopeptide (TPR) repeat protein
MPLLPVVVLLTLFVAPLPDSLGLRVREAPSDSTAAIFQSYIARHPGGDAGVAALLALGQYEYARGEYRDAAAAFARAGARLEPARKGEARYWAALSWFALGDLERARGALEEVARAGGVRRADAHLALAQVWEGMRRSDKALEELDALLATESGEIEATALAMLYEITTSQQRDADADRAAERLLRDHPKSMEAALIGQRVVTPPATQGHVSVRLGAFSDPERARSLAAAARRAGFSDVRILPPGAAGAKLHVVRLGPYADPEHARRQAERAAELLGVIPERIHTP